MAQTNTAHRQPTSKSTRAHTSHYGGPYKSFLRLPSHPARHIVLLAFIALVLLVSSAPAATARAPRPPAPVLAAEVPGAAVGGSRPVLVRFTPGLGPTTAPSVVAGVGGHVTKYWPRLGLAAAMLTPTAVATLSMHPEVVAVEADGLVSATARRTKPPPATPDPSARPAWSWGQDRIDQRTLPLSGTLTTAHTGAGVRVYVVDTGVVSQHTEFSDRVQPGFSAIADGYGTEDCNWHGTHVAGTAAGSGYGVAPQAQIVPVRVLGCDGTGTWSQVIAGLDWILANHPAGTPGVVNMSLGGSPSDAADEAVRAVIAAGLVVVVAAGNDSSPAEVADACAKSPSRVLEAVTVAATTADDARAWWSSAGPCVDLFAPGEGIASASVLGYGGSIGSGTSMAAPHVAGAVAVLAAQRPTSSVAYLMQLLGAAASPGLVGDAATAPNRLLFLPTDPVPASLESLATVSALSATGGRNRVGVSWVAAPGERIEVRLLAGGRVVRFASLAPTDTSVRLTEVAAGTYQVAVVVVSPWGPGPAATDTAVVTGK